MSLSVFFYFQQLFSATKGLKKTFGIGFRGAKVQNFKKDERPNKRDI